MGNPAGKPYAERLTALETPLTERTQSTFLVKAEKALRAAKKLIEGGANARLLKSLELETKEGEVQLEPRTDPVWFTREIEKAEQGVGEARGGEARGKAEAKALLWELKRRHAIFLRRVGKIGERRVVPTDHRYYPAPLPSCSWLHWRTRQCAWEGYTLRAYRVWWRAPQPEAPLVCTALPTE